jgi:hypothetical protein
MATTALQPTTKFLFDDGYMPSAEELIQHIIEVERSNTMTLSEYNQRLDRWLAKNL